MAKKNKIYPDDLLNLIKDRRTIRKYQDKNIPKKILDSIIEAGCWAPSTHNSQPWFYLVIKNSTIKKKIIDILTDKSNISLTSIKLLLKKTINIIETAPIIILVYNKQPITNKVSFLERDISSLAYLSEIESISSAIQNMHLMASCLEIGMAWLTMPLLAKKELNDLVKIKDELAALLTFGYPAEKGKYLKRKPILKTIKYI